MKPIINNNLVIIIYNYKNNTIDNFIEFRQMPTCFYKQNNDK